jgi:hypothetical protein
MDKPAPRESKLAFRNQLKNWGIPELHYQVLEVIFRQTLMSDPKSSYKYDNDFIDNTLCGNMPPEDRFQRLQHYVRGIENKTRLEYGFETVHVDELEKANRIIKQYQNAKHHLERLGQEFGLMFTDKTTHKWLEELQDKVKEGVAINGRQPGRFLTFDVKGVPKQQDSKHEYFTRYIGIHYAIFFDYLNKLSSDKNQKTPLYRLVSAKLKREHPGLLTPADFSPNFILARIHNNKKIDNYYRVPRSLKLIDDPFTAFLAKLAESDRIKAA